MLGGPLGHVGMKSFAVFHDRRQQEQVAAPLQLDAERAG